MAYTFKHGDRPLEGYTIQRAVGRGGFGEVYYAISDGGREVALKYLHENPDVELRGVSHCINLKSPHLVSIFDVKKTSDGEYVIVMEYCSGPSLRDLLIAEPTGFPPEKAAFFVREIAKGLSYLHDRGIVHRDLKPGNIFYDDGYVKIGDYGLSKFISVSRHSAQTASVGTVHYMAPEIGSGDYSRGVDIYALGVIAYEMLRGKVPFEGSSMAEILMKHLTSQPEVDQLPEPFGKIIRKSLEKDPRNRYQTVNEMVDELLGVEAIQKSLAGFSTQSLDGAVARGRGRDDQSPVPSPNPPPRFAGPRGVPVSGAPLPKRVGKRIDRVAQKIDAKIAKMGGRHSPGPAAPSPASPHDVHRAGAGGAARHVHPDKWKRMLLGAVMAVGLAVGLGIVFGVKISEEAGAAAGMLVPAMAGGVALATKAIPWFGAMHGPRWAQLMIQTACSAPLLAVASAPVLDADGERAFAMWIGLLVVSVFANWPKTLDRAETDEVSIGSALWVGFGAFLATAIASGILGQEPVPFMFMAGAVTAAASLVLQASTWWAGGATGQQAAGGGKDGGAYNVKTVGNHPQSPPYAWPVSAETMTYGGRGRGMDPHYGTEAYVHRNDSNADGLNPRIRWIATRAFWSLLAFLLMGGAVVLLLIAIIMPDCNHDDRTATIIGCVACASGMIFALRKTTPVKREGFWRESLRPLLMSAALFGIGATTTGIARHWLELKSDEQGGLITGLVFSSLLFLATLFLRGRRRKPAEFLRGKQGASLAQHGHGSDEGPGDHEISGSSSVAARDM
jgi:hypothetical protein